MTPKELKTTIAEAAADLEWFKKTLVTFEFKHIDQKEEIIGLPALYEYVYEQSQGW
ncbi:MAG: hypothetical protein HYZ42_04405 [Bacteroidetes bacterium]|nr:hypothetical protein [Bacteroidota bacterium]